MCTYVALCVRVCAHIPWHFTVFLLCLSLPTKATIQVYIYILYINVCVYIKIECGFSLQIFDYYIINIYYTVRWWRRRRRQRLLHLLKYLYTMRATCMWMCVFFSSFGLLHLHTTPTSFVVWYTRVCVCLFVFFLLILLFFFSYCTRTDTYVIYVRAHVCVWICVQLFLSSSSLSSSSSSSSSLLFFAVFYFTLVHSFFFVRSKK